MTPLERAARELYKFGPQKTDVFTRDCTKPGDPIRHSQRDTSWADISEEERAPFIAKARAVLTAIREDAYELGGDAYRTILCNKGESETVLAKLVFEAMIDAALAEGG